MKKNSFSKKFFGLAAAGLLALPSASWAASIHFEGFEDPGWTANQAGNWQNYGGNEIDRVASGTDGVTSSAGVGHAQLSVLGTNNNVFGTPTLGALSPYTTLGGYSSSFGGGFSVSQDIYLDINWGDGSGFDFSTAVSNQSGGHLRDFVWHVGVVGSDLLVNASNNSDRSYNAWKLNNENGGNNELITSSGWHTFETVFYDDGGFLSVDFNLYDDSNALLYNVTRTTSDDIASVVGGNRYAWFVYNNVDGLAIDNTHLQSAAPIPEPATMTLLGLGLAGLVARNRRKRA